MYRYIKIIVVLFCLFSFDIKAQSLIEIKPLFEYPVAPEELESIEDRCNYIVKNFWKDFDFKKETTVDQYALNEAFSVYCSALRFASAKESDMSVSNLVKKIGSNPTLLLQFCKAAEINLYSPDAEIWSDPYYLQFLEAVVKNKKIPEKRKTKYINQEKAITGSQIGNVAPDFWFTDTERGSKHYFPMSTPTLLIFGNPDSTDWRLSRLKIDSNFSLSEAIDKGKVNILFIVPQDIQNWQDMVSNYNKKWTIGINDNISSIYDIRLMPSIYVIGSDGKILKKNISQEEAMATILEIIN